MKASGTGMLPIVAAVLILIGVTVLQGNLTDRWKGGDVAEELKRTAASLEKNFPQKFGDWEAEKELETDPRQMEVAGAVGHISRLYRNKTTGTRSTTRPDRNFLITSPSHEISNNQKVIIKPGFGNNPQLII